MSRCALQLPLVCNKWGLLTVSKNMLKASPAGEVGCCSGHAAFHQSQQDHAGVVWSSFLPPISWLWLQWDQGLRLWSGSTGYTRWSFLWVLREATHLLKPSILHFCLTLIIFWSFSRFTGKGGPGRIPGGCQISIQCFNCNELQCIFCKSVSSCFFGVSGTQYKSQLAQVLQAENLWNTYGNTFAWCSLLCTSPKQNLQLCCSIKGKNLRAWSNVYNSIIHEIQSHTLITFMFNFQI